MDSCEAMEMIDKLNEEFSALQKEKDDLQKRFDKIVSMIEPIKSKNKIIRKERLKCRCAHKNPHCWREDVYAQSKLEHLGYISCDICDDWFVNGTMYTQNEYVDYCTQECIRRSKTSELGGFCGRHAYIR